MKNKVFLLSHQDDEMAIFNHIKDSALSGNNTYIFYLTNGNVEKKLNNKIILKRENESTKVLIKLGVKKKNIFFLGKKLKISSYNLHKNLDVTFRELSKFFNKLNLQTVIYSHAWEGGNTDHDSSYVITLKLMHKFSKISSAFQFALYNSYNMPFKFFRVLYPIKQNGPIIKKDINFLEKIKFIILLFFYKTQFKVWLGLYPFIIFKIILNKYGYLQEIKKKTLLRKPHSNKLWYEKKNFISYNKLKLVFNLFLK